jgi:hypothetical protein
MLALSRVVFASVAAATAVVPLARAQSLDWRVASGNFITTCQMVYDVARSRFVAFAEPTTPMDLPFVEWDGNGWRERAMPGPLPPRISFGLAYDIGRGRVVLFGGRTGSPLNDLWEYDGVKWFQRTPAVQPAARYAPLMTYDRARGNVLLVGGSSATSLLQDTWHWNGTSWQSVPAIAPFAMGAAMASHPSSGRVVLVRPAGQTWTYDGVTWTQVASSAPPAPSYRATTDLAGDRVVLLGFDSPTISQWNGSTWSVTAPFDGRRDCGLAADLSGRVIAYAGQRLVTLGGVTTTVPLNDTWSIAGGGNTQLDAGEPIVVQYPQVAWDSIRRRLVCVGSSLSAAVQDQTWEHDGTIWRNAGAAVPSATIDARMCFDLLRGRIVRFGGFRGFSPRVLTAELSEWNGTQWILRTSSGPTPRSSHAMTYDVARGVVLVFGGTTTGYPAGSGLLGDTWQWDGNNWTQLAITGPSPRMDAAMAFDPGRAQAVLFGGRANAAVLGETWLLVGTNWMQATPARSPAPRWRASIDYDLARGRTVMVGGLGQTQLLSELWEWDGNNWQQGTTLLPPMARNGDYLTSGAIADGRWMLASQWTTWIGDATPARAVVTGTGCGGASVPALRAYGDPVLGSATFAAELHRVGAQALFLLGLGAGTASAPIGAGCTVYLPQLDDTLCGVAGPTGFARIPLPVPSAPQLIGLEVSLQAGAVDALAPLGFALSDAVVARIGH